MFCHTSNALAQPLSRARVVALYLKLPLSFVRNSNALSSLHGCAGLPEPLLFAYVYKHDSFCESDTHRKVKFHLHLHQPVYPCFSIVMFAVIRLEIVDISMLHIPRANEYVGIIYQEFELGVDNLFQLIPSG